MSPMCPVETVPPQPDCEPAPIAATLRVLDDSGNDIARVGSEADGQYSVALDPGHYVLQALPLSATTSFPIPPAPVEVDVSDGAWISVDLDYDTGIR